MHTYLIFLRCDFPEGHRTEDCELLIAVHADSAEQVEAPLRDQVIREQAKAGFTKAHIEHIVQVPDTSASTVLSFSYLMGGANIRQSESDWLEPVWFQKLIKYNTAEEDAAYHALLVRLAKKSGEAPPTWDGKESLGHSIEPFLTFSVAEVAEPCLDQDNDASV